MARVESELTAERARTADLSARLQIAEYEMERYDVNATEAVRAADALRDENKTLTGELQVSCCWD